MAAPELVLASASPRRRELLALLGLPFEVVPSAYEERLPDRHPDPAALAEHLATEKALDVARSRPGAVVVGADTIVALGDRIYGKPADAADAERMLAELSGRTHVVVTGVGIVAPAEGVHEGGVQVFGCSGVQDGGRPEGRVRSFSVSTDVAFRALEEVEIRAYAGTGEPMDKAGAYAIQGYGALLIEGIRGDYPNVVGLPVLPLALALRELGITVLGERGGIENGGLSESSESGRDPDCLVHPLHGDVGQGAIGTRDPPPVDRTQMTEHYLGTER